MTPTVAKVISLPVLQRGNPEVLCDSGFDRQVRWVHVSDVADLSGFLQGGELVLTTGSALLQAPRRYLASIAAAGAIGVVVEIGDGMRLPRKAGAIAADLGLALVALHREIRFVEVTEQVHRMIVTEQYDEVEFARRTHETFTDLGIRRGSVADIVDAAAHMLDTPIVLEDLSHQAVAVAPIGYLAADLLANWDRKSRLHGAGTPAPETVEWTATPVGRQGEEWGRLIALRTPTLSTRTIVVLERAAQALVMHRMAEKGRFDIEHQAQAGLMDDVLRNRIRSEPEAAARAFALGLRAAREYIPATVRARHWPKDSDPVAAQRRNVRLLDAAVGAVKSSGHTGLCSIHGPGEIGMILSLQLRGGRTRDGALAPLGVALRREIQRSGEGSAVVFGVAAPRPTLVDAIHGISEAANVTEAALSMPPDGPSCYRVADIRLRGLVSMLRSDDRVQRFAEAELRGLILDDLENGDDLTSVLRGFLQLAGNKSALAQRLHMSRAGLYAKLARIEHILGVDLRDGESTTSLHVALLVLDAQNQR